MGSNPSTVFRRVKAFEDDIGTKLFERTSEGYFLNTHGEQLFAEMLEIEERIEAVSRKIYGLDEQLRGEVILTTTDTFALTLLPSVIKAFFQAYPNLRLDIRVSSQFFNLSKREADIALRPSSTPPEHLIGRKLGKVHFAVYASVEYLQNHPNTGFPSEKQALIGADQSLSHLKSKKWFDRFVTDATYQATADNLMTIAHLCHSGMGFAALPTYFENYFPNLRKVHTSPEFIGSDLWLLTHKDFKNLSRIKVTMDFLYEQVQERIGPYLV